MSPTSESEPTPARVDYEVRNAVTTLLRALPDDLFDHVARALRALDEQRNVKRLTFQGVEYTFVPVPGGPQDPTTRARKAAGGAA